MKTIAVVAILLPLLGCGMEKPLKPLFAPDDITKAAARGNLIKVARFLTQNVSPDTRNNESTREAIGIDDSLSINPDAGNTALMNACLWGHLDVVKLLLKSGANPNLYNLNGKTALLLCNKYTNVMAELLKAKANPNIGDQSTGVSALMLAIMSEDTTRAKLLLAHGADPDQIDCKHWNARIYALSAGPRSGFEFVLFAPTIKQVNAAECVK